MITIILEKAAGAKNEDHIRWR